MDDQVARLEDLLELHEEIAGGDAAELADRVSCDTSAAGERLRRGLTAKGSELRQTLELLLKMQKGENNGHGACDGANAKGGETPETETETPALSVAILNEDHCEPGATATPGPKKPNRDKSRSLAALEMVRSGRLDEQGFESSLQTRLPRWWCSRVCGSSRSGRCCSAEPRWQPGALVRGAPRGNSGQEMRKSKPMTMRRKLKNSREI